MNRRETIKSLLIGSLSGGLILVSCDSNISSAVEESLWKYKYGRTPKEEAYDQKLLKEKLLTDDEMTLVVVLSNLILPPTDHGTIEQAEVPEFIEFMLKDVPDFQNKIRGGFMWLNSYSNKKYDKHFINLSADQQKSILDKIAFPDPTKENQLHEVQFFSLMRGLVMTGYFTSKVGIEEIGYVGNIANAWDGVPEDVLSSVGMSYEKEWIDRCVDQSKRYEQAEWDDEGNLLT
jgi:hypothetical protein